MDDIPANSTPLERSSQDDNGGERGRSIINPPTQTTAATTTAATATTPTTSHMNGATSRENLGGGSVNSNGVSPITRIQSRRPQTQTPSPIEQKSLLAQVLSLTIHKDSNGYGMKVSGDNPVYVESVKAGGAAQKAGLIAGDMILKVNGVEVRAEKHTTVVQLIKSRFLVELTVQRSQKMQRPNSIGSTSSTPIAPRDRITGPQPVDNEMRKEMEYSKIKTLRLMLEREQITLESLSATSADRVRVESTIRKLQEQLRQAGAEDSPKIFLSPTTTITTPTTVTPPVVYPLTSPQQHSSPAFLSRFPRSLSSLSLGTRKKTEKDIPSPLSNNNIQPSPEQLSSTSLLHHHHHQQQQQQGLHNMTPTKRKFIGSERNLKEETPPPLPQRNPPRKLMCPPEDGGGNNHQHPHAGDWRRNIPISDLDNSVNAMHNQSQSFHHHHQSTKSMSSGGAPSALPVAIGSQSLAGGSKPLSAKKRPKTKTKALSDPKMSTQMFLQMEKEHGTSLDDPSNTPPPLPPRQPGMMEENQNFSNNAKVMMSTSNSMMGLGSGLQGSTSSLRPLPNSIDTLMNYPLVATCTSVRDNLLAFPLSQRPNIVQKLQHHQQQQQQQQNQQQYLSNSFHHNMPSVPPHSSASVNKSNVLGHTPAQKVTNLTKHRRVVSSPEHFQERPPDRHNSSSGSWEILERNNEPTPPGTPPPPYLSPMQAASQNLQGADSADNIDNEQKSTYLESQDSCSGVASNEIMVAQANTVQKEILLMDDDEVSDQDCIVDEEAPFNYVARLLKTENTVYLAVFLNYLLSNCDPAPLLFYLITELYRQGNGKEMRKWAYEIHSTFLVPSAPLLWFKVDEPLAHEVDKVLQDEYDKVEILNKVFWKSRKKAKEKISEQLRIFQQRRIEGMGTIYGPTDQQLSMAKGDKAKEQKIFEETLLPKLQELVHQLENNSTKPEKLALTSALSTVLYKIFMTRSNSGGPFEQVTHFVSREKSFKKAFGGRSRKPVSVQGHPFVLRQYYEVTHCNHCQTIIWGVSPQGYQCTNCKLNLHRLCVSKLQECCPGPLHMKSKLAHSDTKISKLMEKIRPTHHFIQNERTRRMDEDAVDDSFLTDRPVSASVARQPSDRRPDLNSTSLSANNSMAGALSDWTSQSVDSETNPLDGEPESSRKERSKSKSAPVSVNRSESYKERLSQKRNRNNRRKTSDPSLTKTNDEQDVSLSNHAGSSSSSISLASSESPSISLEQVAGSTALNSVNTSQLATATASAITSKQWPESEEEDPDHTETDWSSNVAAEVLASLSDIEKKRQEIINEIYQTERSHVRTLKLLDRIFMRPLLECGVLPHDHLQLLFPPGLLSLKDIHSAFEHQLKQRRSEHVHVIRTLGDLLADMFEGKCGEELREHAAQVCAHQQIALEVLKEKRKKDEHVHRFLSKAESHKSCRRLQLKDLLPTVLQRLTKYPLLFDNLLTITKRVDPYNIAELNAIQRALDSSKQILVYVNQAVKAAEDAHTLQTIQRKLDFDKDLGDLRNLDLTQYNLIYDGHLQMKKNPSIQLHGLLFENMIILLQKLDDKYLLRNFPHTTAGGGDEFISPITLFDHQTLVRQSAADKTTFFLIITKTSQMLELKAPSSAECQKWFKHISAAAEQYKPRSQSSHDVAEDPASATLPHSNTKESLESTTDRLSTETPTPTTANASRQPVDQSTPTRVTNDDSTIEPEAEMNVKENQRDSLKSVNDKTTANNQEPQGSSAIEGDSKLEVTTTKKCDNSSSLLSNNSNNTRTLTQHCALLEPSEIQISISPAHTAEPVLTNSERLRRLDDKIRDELLQKERIICDMFRVPHEHFAAIVDVASQPEAPKDTANIAIAAFAHVQSLTDILTQYMKITPEQEISAVSTAVCDRCYQQRSVRTNSPMPPTVTVVDSGTPTPCNLVSSTQAECDVYDDKIIQEDDGYCQIDELRLPSIGISMVATPAVSSTESSSSDAPPNVAEAEMQSLVDLKSQPPQKLEQDAEQTEKSIQKDGDQITSDRSKEYSEKEGLDDNRQRALDGSTGNDDREPSDNHDTTTSQTKCLIDMNNAPPSVKCQFIGGTNELNQTCGPNRFSHAYSLGPSVPCHAISGIVNALSTQISLLLPKINERDIERERLRRENQHLRELLNSMHARQRVEEEKETPENTESADNPPT